MSAADTATPGRSRVLGYAIVATMLFVIEVAIALRLLGAPGTPGAAFIRGSVGDILAVIFVYCVLRAFDGAVGGWRLSPGRAAIIAVAIGVAIEFAQLARVAELLGLQRGGVLYIVIGSTFSVMDIVMYVIGGVLAWLLDRAFTRQR